MSLTPSVTNVPSKPSKSSDEEVCARCNGTGYDPELGPLEDPYTGEPSPQECIDCEQRRWDAIYDSRRWS